MASPAPSSTTPKKFGFSRYMPATSELRFSSRDLWSRAPVLRSNFTVRSASPIGST
jgi:hypothetical protein